MLRLALSSLSFLSCASLGLGAADYHVVARFHLGGDASRFDYLRADPVNRRLFVAHDKRFEVLDLDSGKKVGEIAPTSRAHGVALAPDYDHGFATSGNDNTVIMFNLRTLQVLAVTKSTGTNPDSVEYDAGTRRVYAVNGSSGNVTVFDPATGAVVGTVALSDGKLEQIGFDGRGHAFVNNEVKSCVQVFDTHSLKATATWSLAPGEGGTGLAVDGPHHRLFSTCGNNKLVVLDTDTGKVIATPAIGEDADGVAFDPASGAIFTSNADATVSVLHEDGPDSYKLTATVGTAEGCKTIGYDEKTGRIFLATAQFGPKPAPTKEVPEPRAPVVPGTLDILVLGQ